MLFLFIDILGEGYDLHIVSYIIFDIASVIWNYFNFSLSNKMI